MDAIAIGVGLWIGWRIFRKDDASAAFFSGRLFSVFRTCLKTVSEPAGALFRPLGYYPGDERAALMQSLANAFAERDAAITRAEDLLARLSDADRRVVSLQGELTQVRRSAPADPLFRSVGLAENAEPFLIEAARRAFRKQYHPDTKPAHEKLAAQREFQKHENAFEKIRALKGLR